MNRRLYFLLPDTVHARSVIDELTDNGLQRKQMHTIARDPCALMGLPNATIRQRQDIGRLVEAILWDSNLAVFGLALGVFLSLLTLSGQHPGYGSPPLSWPEHFWAAGISPTYPIPT